MDQVPSKESTETTAFNLDLRDAFEQLFPGTLLDGVLDASRLGEVLGLQISGLKDNKERFGLMWSGRSEAIAALQAKSMAALRPEIEDSKIWEKAKNVFVSGDNLEVLKLLQNAYNDQFRVIYVDPPYNTGNDFVYHDDFSDPIRHYLEVTGQVDGDGNRLVANLETSGRKHSNWLTMMYPRLALARNLLSEDGLIAISVDDVEHANVVLICKEIFGEENYLASVARVAKRTSNKGTHFAPSKDYIVVFARNAEVLPPLMDSVSDDYKKRFGKIDDKGAYGTVSLYMASLDSMRGCINQRYWVECPDGTFAIPPGEHFPAEVKDGFNESPQTARDKVWRWSFESYLAKKDLLVFKQTKTSPLVDQYGNQSKWNVYTKYYLEDRLEDGMRPRDFIEDSPNDLGTKALKKLNLNGVFDFAKPVELIKKILTWVNDPDALVLDFFAGSGTTGQAVHELNQEDSGNRRFVLVNLPEPTPEKSLARQEGFDNVAQITDARLKAVMSTDEGFRKFNLGVSNFLSLNDSDFLFETLESKYDESSLIWQILLSIGHRLDETVTKAEILGSSVNFCGRTALVTRAESLAFFEEMISTHEIRTLICLEDNLQGRDALKANLYFAAKKRNITFKTF
jgi:adenine-specific DNA-methyltransferase